MQRYLCEFTTKKLVPSITEGAERKVLEMIKTNPNLSHQSHEAEHYLREIILGIDLNKILVERFISVKIS